MSALRTLRGGAHAAIEPAVVVLSRAGVSPDLLTWSSLGVCAVGGAALGLGAPPVTAGIVLVLRLLLDLLDGQLARRSGRVTRAGALLNDVEDGLGDVLLYSGLAVALSSRALFVFTALGAASELVAVAVVAQGGPRSHRGPLAKAERIVLVAGTAALAQAGVPVELLYGVGCLLAAWTLARRLHGGLQALAPDRV